VLKLVLPPVVPLLASWLRQRRHGGAPVVSPEWEYCPGGWEEAHSRTGARGWDQRTVAAALERSWPDFVASFAAARPFGRSNEAVSSGPSDLGFHNVALTFGYVLGAAARGRARLSILDWGGGVGAYLALARALQPDVEIDYVCKELPAICEVGRRLMPAGRFEPDAAACLGRRYDLVLASSSLQYERDWKELLARLRAACVGYLFVTRTPFAEGAPSFVVLQRAQRYGYGTEYLGWCLNRTEFLAESRRLGLHLIREFLVDERIEVPGAPETANYRGFLFDSDRDLPLGE
jgi:putative methyltransferase (TIGR04325 family)